MIARKLVTDSIPPLRTSDTIQTVLDRMAEFRVNHLPIINHQQFLGLITSDDLIEIADHTLSVGSLSLSSHNPFVHEWQHIYDVIRLFYEQNLSVVPVIDKNNNYLGVISINTMIKYMATIASVKQPGAIIILEINNRDNSMTHIAQIIESDNVQILSSYVESFPDSTKLEITLKLNRVEVSAIVAAFVRYNYIVKGVFNDAKSNEGAMDRYDQLMNYLDI